MLKAFKYRLYPNEAQKVLLEKHFGAYRFVYNLALETKRMAYSGWKVNLSAYALQRQLTQLKKDLPWLIGIDTHALYHSIFDLDVAYNKYFKGMSEFPRFKSKWRDGCSFRSPYGAFIKIKDGKLYQNKFRDGIRVKIDRQHIGEIRSTTISKTATGKYFVSVLCDTGVPEPIKPTVNPATTTGLDLGLTHFVITSEGIKIENPKYLKKLLGKLAALQRRASRKKLGSKNRKKANKRVAVLHERISNQRKDFLHKLSSELIKNHDSIAVEDLNIKGMVKNRKLARSILDASWGEFIRQIEYKANWYGKNFLQIGRFEPSSKTCSRCGAVNKELKLHQREWTCICGATHDRDINAAINIKQFALKNSGVGCPVEPVELPSIRRAMKQEVDFTAYQGAKERL